MPRGRKKNVEKEEKSYSPVPEAQEIIVKLCERYPEILWAVTPKEVGCFGVESEEKPASCKTLAKIRAVTGIYKSVLEQNNIGTKFLIEMYWSDWNSFKIATKNMVIFHELLHIGEPGDKGLRKHSIEDFALTVDLLGVKGYTGDNVPDLLGTEKVQFDKALIAQMQKQDDAPEDSAPTPPE